MFRFNRNHGLTALIALSLLLACGLSYFAWRCFFPLTPQVSEIEYQNPAQNHHGTYRYTCSEKYLKALSRIEKRRQTDDCAEKSAADQAASQAHEISARDSLTNEQSTWYTLRQTEFIFWQLILGIVTFVFAAGAIVISFFSAEDSRRGLKAERARLFVRFAQTAGTNSRFFIGVRNIGRSAAIIDSMHFRISDTMVRYRNRGLDTVRMGTVIIHEVEEDIFEYVPVGHNQAIYGHIRYEDIFGENHRIHFFFRYDVIANTVTGMPDQGTPEDY